MAETVTMAEAARRLGVSNTKIWRLVREGALPARKNPLDGRERLIRTIDLDRFSERDRELPHFVSDGSANVPEAPRAAEIEDYLRQHWHS